MQFGIDDVLNTYKTKFFGREDVPSFGECLMLHKQQKNSASFQNIKNWMRAVVLSDLDFEVKDALVSEMVELYDQGGPMQNIFSDFELNQLDEIIMSEENFVKIKQVLPQAALDTATNNFNFVDSEGSSKSSQYQKILNQIIKIQAFVEDYVGVKCEDCKYDCKGEFVHCKQIEGIVNCFNNLLTNVGYRFSSAYNQEEFLAQIQQLKAKCFDPQKASGFKVELLGLLKEELDELFKNIHEFSLGGQITNVFGLQEDSAEEQRKKREKISQELANLVASNSKNQPYYKRPNGKTKGKKEQTGFFSRLLFSNPLFSIFGLLGTFLFPPRVSIFESRRNQFNARNNERNGGVR